MEVTSRFVRTRSPELAPVQREQGDLMTQLLVNIDVDDLVKAQEFYTRAFGLRVGRKLGPDFWELVGGPVPIYLILKAAGTPPFDGAQATRTYDRHWSPVHLDLVVPDIHSAIERALSAGARLERAPVQEPYGLLALLSDPFGHGFCFIQFEAEGYDAIATG